MANPVSGVSGVQQAAQAEAPPPAAKPPAKSNAAPQDTVTISAAGKAASQTQPVAGSQQSSGQSYKEQAKK
jgi:hypothetical protein